MTDSEVKDLYFGSVRFFKHLFLLLIIVTVVSLIIAVINISSQNRELNQVLKNRSLESMADIDPDSLNPAGQDSTEPFSLEYTIYYQSLYPELYCDNEFRFADDADKVIYLTFDDGPSQITSEVLDKLKQSDLKATFFVIGKNIPGNEDILRRIVTEGHALGVHSYSHDMGMIYCSVEAYLEDFQSTYQLIKAETGVSPELLRFPGGSINGYNAKNHKFIISEMLRRGFTYYDWNITDEDLFRSATAETVKDTVFSGFPPYGEKGIVQIHESNYSLQALDEIILKMEEEGYAFAKLSKSVRPIIFAYPH